MKSLAVLIPVAAGLLLGACGGTGDKTVQQGSVATATTGSPKENCVVLMTGYTSSVIQKRNAGQTRNDSLRSVQPLVEFSLGGASSNAIVVQQRIAEIGSVTDEYGLTVVREGEQAAHYWMTFRISQWCDTQANSFANGTARR